MQFALPLEAMRKWKGGKTKDRAFRLEIAAPRAKHYERKNASGPRASWATNGRSANGVNK